MATRRLALAIFFTTLTVQSSLVRADFRVVVKTEKPEAATINYGAPVAASKPLPGSVSFFARSRPIIREIGVRTDLSKMVTSGIASFGSPFGSILKSVVPLSLELNISKDADLSKGVDINIKSGTPWVKALGKLLVMTHCYAVINWNSSSITIGVNSNRDMDSIMKRPTKEIEGNGATYIIRKKSDDLLQRKSAGFIVKDGKVIRFDADKGGH